MIERRYFDLMQPRVIAGRLFVASDETAESRGIVLGEALASRLFAPGVSPLGGKIFVGDSAFIVIGVLSRYADFPEQHSGFVDFSSSPSSAWILGAPRKNGGYTRVVRVRPGTTRRQLERELAVVSERIAVAVGEAPRDDAFRVAGTTQEQVRVQGLQLALVSAVVAVLLVACANVANMQLARGIGRSRELALRAALGASRRQIVMHLLTESTVLAVGGLLLGLVMTYWFGVALHASIPPAIGAFIVEPKFSWRVLVFALIAMVACIVMVGLAPAVRVSRVDPNDMLKSGAGTGASRRNRRQYAYLVVVEIALSLALLCASAVTVQSALRMADGDAIGYDPSPLATGVAMTAIKPQQQLSRPELFATILDRIRALPGVADAAVSTSGGFANQGITIADSSGMRSLPVPGYGYTIVSPSYFRTFGRPIIAGRDFRDGERDQPAIIIDEYTAKKLWPNANPVGALIKLGDDRSTRPFVRIVGVVGMRDAHGEIKPLNMADASGATIGYVYYLPSVHDSLIASPLVGGISVVVRTDGDVNQLATAMRRAGIYRAAPLVEQMGLVAQRSTTAFMSTLFTLFAATALGLAVFGVYGVVAHSVAERRRELGVRIALGATARDILHTVLRETTVVGLSGIAFGLLVAKSKLYVLQSFAYGGDIYNAPLFAVVSLFLLAATAFAAFIPARRATLVDPTESLRSE